MIGYGTSPRSAQLVIALITVAEHLDFPESLADAIEMSLELATFGQVEVEEYQLCDLAVLLKVSGFSPEEPPFGNAHHAIEVNGIATVLDEEFARPATIQETLPCAPKEPAPARRKGAARTKVTAPKPLDFDDLGSLLASI